MFFVMLLSSVIGVLFAFCGLMGGFAFFIDAQQGMSMSAFLQGFTSATWPLVAACALFLLQHLLKEVSALREAEEQPAMPRPPAPKLKKNTAPAEEESPAAPVAPAGPVYFPVRETAQGPRIVRPAEEKPATPAPSASPSAATSAPAPAAPSEPAKEGLMFFKTH